MQKVPIRFDSGEGTRVAQFVEAVAFDRPIYDGLQVGTSWVACTIVRRSGFPALHQLDGEHVGSDAHAPL